MPFQRFVAASAVGDLGSGRNAASGTHVALRGARGAQCGGSRAVVRFRSINLLLPLYYARSRRQRGGSGQGWRWALAAAVRGIYQYFFDINWVHS